MEADSLSYYPEIYPWEPEGFEESVSDTGGSIDIAPGDGPRSMSIECEQFVEIVHVASVDPFEMPSRSIGQLCGNRTLVGRVLLKIIGNIFLKPRAS
ncbi:hypothetical protein F2Q69_00059706 [Brassica cretica]|uniref:Uncharacterized protein n=1 Tax=Brassica cretica TaxID=69181 RepID=A0A8S9RPJ7_BRACR|nr:hypothetical protein F2Q69_00059706 [Brassica cretica]